MPVHSRWCPDFEGTLYAGGIVRWPILCQMPISTASLCHTHATIKELLHGFSHRLLHSHLISWLLCWSNLWATWLLWLLVLKLFLIGNWLLNMQTTTTQAWECARTAWPRCPLRQWHEPLGHGEALREAERRGNSNNNENFSYLQGKLDEISHLDMVLGVKVWISKITSPLNR